MEPY